MSAEILFGGVTGVGPAADPSSSTATMAEFAHYVGTIWVHENPVPTDAQALAAFDTAALIPQYKAFRAEGGRVPTERGLTLEEGWMVQQLFTRQPLVCLISARQPPPPSSRISRKTLLEPGTLLSFVMRAFTIRLNRRDIEGQITRWGSLSPAYFAYVFDGRVGHCITLVGIEHRAGRIVYFDPWPGRSLLCSENNAAGVSAEQAPEGQRYWFVSPSEMERVVFAVFLPEGKWRTLTGAPGHAAVASPVPEPPRSPPPDAEVRLHRFLEVCAARRLLTPAGESDLVAVGKSGKLWDLSSEGRDTLFYLHQIAADSARSEAEAAEVLNRTLRMIAVPSSIHQ